MNTAHDPAAFLGTRTARHPIGRILRPSEIADAVHYLSSPASDGMTGSALTVHGGLTASFDYRAATEGYGNSAATQ